MGGDHQASAAGTESHRHEFRHRAGYRLSDDWATSSATPGYRWSGCVANLKAFDEKTCNDDARWRQIDEDWYTSGKPYRDFEHTIGGRNPIFHDWLDHPSYDRFWQKLIPYKEQFRHVKIPVLATTGYYASGEVGTLYYFTEHYEYDPHANHTLLIGPYDDGSMQHGAPANLRGTSGPGGAG